MTEGVRALFFLLLSGTLFPYSFGKNKVQFREFDWKVLKTPHFRIYFYEGGETLAEFAYSVLESYYPRYTELLNVEIPDPIPVILYNAQRDFMQTNVILDLLEEGVGGFTEVFKNRMVVPFSGSYDDFRHVLAHELVHVFQFYILIRGFRPSLTTSPLPQLPLWLAEGSAEYLSQGWNDEAESFMRDLVINDAVVPVPDLERWSGYLVYKEGQAILRYIAETFGEKKIGEIIHQVKLRKNLDAVFQSVFGENLESFNEDFLYDLKKRYYPLIRDFELPRKYKQLTDHRKEGGFMNVAPALSPDGSMVALISDRKGYSDIYLLSTADGTVLKKLVSGGKSPDLENLHLFRPGLSFSPDGRFLVFASQGSRKDFLHIVDVRKGKIIRSFSPSEPEAMYTPHWGPNGKIYFVGLKNGMADLYELDPETGGTRRLTHDLADDRDPSLGPDGRLYFASDRFPMKGDTFRYGSYAVFSLDPATGDLRQETPFMGDLRFPQWIPDKGIAFVTNENGAYNLFLYREGKVYRLTHFLTRIREAQWSANGEKLAFSLQWKGGFDVYVARTEDLEEVPLDTLPMQPPKEILLALPEGAIAEKYSLDFSIDWLAGSAEYFSPLGLIGSFTIGISDALGDHRIALYSSNPFGDILNSDFELDYLYLPKRIDWGFSVSQYLIAYPYPYRTRYDYVLERQLGAEVLAYYPFDRFKRIELGLGWRYPLQRIITYDPIRREFRITAESRFKYVTAYGAFVYDDALYTPYAPIDGTRFFIGGERAFLSDYRYTTLIGDFRKYFRLTPRSVLALRLMGGHSGGPNAYTFWIGDPDYLRGYDYYEAMGNNFVLLNAELRVPFIDYLRIAFPLPLTLGGVRGVLLADVGGAWSNDQPFSPFEREGMRVKLKDLKGSLGMGLRLGLGFIQLKFDAVRRTDWAHFEPGWRYYLSLGLDY